MCYLLPMSWRGEVSFRTVFVAPLCVVCALCVRFLVFRFFSFQNSLKDNCADKHDGYQRKCPCDRVVQKGFAAVFKICFHFVLQSS